MRTWWAPLDSVPIQKLKPEHLERIKAEMKRKGSSKRTSTKVAGRKAVVQSRPAPAARKANPHAALPARQIRKTSKASKFPHSAEPIVQARPLDDSSIRKASQRLRDAKAVKGKGQRTMPKPEIELTPDGFVKWWK